MGVHSNGTRTLRDYVDKYFITQVTPSGSGKDDGIVDVDGAENRKHLVPTDKPRLGESVAAVT